MLEYWKFKWIWWISTLPHTFNCNLSASVFKEAEECDGEPKLMIMPRIPDRSTHLIIRMALHGCTNRPFYHLVVCKNRAPRNGRYLECLGSYDPMPNKYGEQHVAIDIERLKFNLATGTQMTKTVEKLLGLSGLLPLHPMTYIEAQRIKAGKEKSDTALRHWNFNVYELFEEEKAKLERAEENDET